MTTYSNPAEAVFIIADDDAVARQSFKRAMKKAGAINTILEARDGAEALELLHLEWEKPQVGSAVVLLDLNMPGVDGPEFVKELDAATQFDPVKVFPMGIDLCHNRICPRVSTRAVGLLDKCDPVSGIQLVFDTLADSYILHA